MKLKIDENLPANCAVLLRNAGFEADTVADEGLSGADDTVIASRSRSEHRVLVTPARAAAGIIVLRSKRLDKPTVLTLMQRIVLALTNRTPVGELWIVEADRIRIRAG